MNETPIVLEMFAFTFQSIAALLSLWVFVVYFDELWKYDGPSVRNRAYRIFWYEFRRILNLTPRMSPPPRDEILDQLCLATKAINCTGVMFLSWFILFLRITWHWNGGWTQTTTPLMFGFMLFHILLGLVASSISLNVMIYFYGRRSDDGS